MGANVFSRHQTQPDSLRLFMHVKGSQFDSARPRQTPWNSLTRKRSLVQIQYGPPGKGHESNISNRLRGHSGANCSALSGVFAIAADEIVVVHAAGSLAITSPRLPWPYRNTYLLTMRPAATA